jgi:hypothetical protein
VGPELTSLPRTTSCPSCGGALRPEATWCSLCFHDFRAAAAPVPEVPAHASALPAYGGDDPLTAPLLDLLLPAAPAVPAHAAPAPEAHAPVPHADVPQAREPQAASAEPSWPCLRCGDLNPLAASMCSTCGATFLAPLAAKPSLVLPIVGDLHAMSRGRRAGLAGIAVLVLMVPVAALTMLTSSTHRPATPPSTGTGVGTTFTTAP